MIFPGLKKLEKEFGFKDNGTLIYGFIKNSYISFADGNNQKNVWFRFPVKLDEEDRQKISAWQKKGYANAISFFDDDIYDIKINFMEFFVPFKVSKIKEIILDITDYISQKYPEAKLQCCGNNCSSTENLEVYDVDGAPLVLCPSCAERLNNEIENAYEEEKLVPNNYLQGTVMAAVFAIPGILLSFFFFLLGRIASITGLLYFYLAQKGYTFAKGKLNKIGVIIISLVSLLYSAFGTFISYIGIIIKEVYKDPSVKAIPFKEIFGYTISVVLYDPEVRREMLSNIYITLFMCGICIFVSMAQLLKKSGKTKMKKA